MLQPKSLVAAFALAALVTTGGLANAGDKGNRMYIEIGGSAADTDDVTTSFTGDEPNASWDLSELVGAKFQFGGDFGHFRTDVKVRGFVGDVDAINGTSRAVVNVGTGETRSGVDAALAVGTVNIYIDIYDIELGDHVTLTPYIGGGLGYVRGFMQTCGLITGLPSDNVGGTRCDQKNDSGNARTWTLGAALEVADTVALTAEYERLDSDVIDAHTANVGLRLSF